MLLGMARIDSRVAMITIGSTSRPSVMPAVRMFGPMPN